MKALRNSNGLTVKELYDWLGLNKGQWMEVDFAGDESTVWLLDPDTGLSNAVTTVERLNGNDIILSHDSN